MTFSAFIRIVVFCFASAVLFGQSIQIGGMRVGAENRMLERIMEQIVSNRPATLVLLDTHDKAWEGEFGRIRREDPFAVFNLPFITLEIDRGAGNALREREGWQPGSPHWAIYNNRSRACPRRQC